MGRIVFGPVPSRRLGRSLGVNNLPQKWCTYSCIYCQVGRTKFKVIARRKFYEVNEVVEEVLKTIGRLGTESIDYVTFVPNGEPTLDINLGKEIKAIKDRTNVRVAVITNASLLWMEDVRYDLYMSDYVSIKVDSMNEDTWRLINRPHKELNLGDIAEGIKEFSKNFRGILTTEVMLVQGVNTKEDSVQITAKFLSKIKGLRAIYLSVPVRPPAENWVRPPTPEEYMRVYTIFSSILGSGLICELRSLEEGSFGGSGLSPIDEVLSIVRVHPLHLDKLSSIARKYGLSTSELLNELLSMDLVRIIEYRGQKFLVLKDLHT